MALSYCVTVSECSEASHQQRTREVKTLKMCHSQIRKSITALKKEKKKCHRQSSTSAMTEQAAFRHNALSRTQALIMTRV